MPIGAPEMLRCARGFGLKARSVTTKWERLAGIPLPAIAFLLLGKAGDDNIIVQAPFSLRPTLMTPAEFEAIWDGRLVLMTRRAALTV
jgi:subfamily B ATP-binding cassette protein HlyB/CyaB